ncbi:flagellar protein FlaG [Oxalobacteraceae bacterium A2-2]
MNINPTTSKTSATPDYLTAVQTRAARTPAEPAVQTETVQSVTPGKQAQDVNKTDLKNSVDAINKFLKVNSQVQFSIDDDTGGTVVKVVDTETKQVLRQFPSEQALEISKDLQKQEASAMKGLLIKGEA